MNASYRIGTLFAIPIRVHVLFLALMGLIAVSGLMDAGFVTALGSVIMVGSVFLFVLLHELGHSLAALFFGIPVRDITLLPIGGIARLGRMPTNPLHEIIIAVAGPAVNLIFVILFGMLGMFTGIHAPFAGSATLGAAIVSNLFWINMMMALFNLIPAFPMDGGRILRGALALTMNYDHASIKAAKVGQTLAVGMAIVGLFYNPWLVFIAIFVFMAARSEKQLAYERMTLGRDPVFNMMRHFFTPYFTPRQEQRVVWWRKY